LALALKTTFDPAAARDLNVRCQLRLDGDSLLVTIHDGQLDVARTDGADTEVVIETSVAVFRSLIFGGSPLHTADVTIRGDREVATWLLRLFKRRAPVAGAG
jgi:hypothetical protein